MDNLIIAATKGDKDPITLALFADPKTKQRVVTNRMASPRSPFTGARLKKVNSATQEITYNEIQKELVSVAECSKCESKLYVFPSKESKVFASDLARAPFNIHCVVCGTETKAKANQKQLKSVLAAMQNDNTADDTDTTTDQDQEEPVQDDSGYDDADRDYDEDEYTPANNDNDDEDDGYENGEEGEEHPIDEDGMNEDNYNNDMANGEGVDEDHDSEMDTSDEDGGDSEIRSSLHHASTEDYDFTNLDEEAPEDLNSAQDNLNAMSMKNVKDQEGMDEEARFGDNSDSKDFTTMANDIADNVLVIAADQVVELNRLDVAMLNDYTAIVVSYDVTENKFYPVAVLDANKATANNQELFKKPAAFRKAFKVVAENLDDVAKLVDFGVTPITFKIGVQDAVATLVEAEIAENNNKLLETKNTMFNDISQCISIAALQTSKRLIKDDVNPVREELISAMTRSGMRDASTVVDAAFAVAGPELFKGIIKRANEMYKKPLIVRNEIAEHVAEAAAISTPIVASSTVNTVGKELASGNVLPLVPTVEEIVEASSRPISSKWANIVSRKTQTTL